MNHGVYPEEMSSPGTYNPFMGIQPPIKDKGRGEDDRTGEGGGGGMIEGGSTRPPPRKVDAVKGGGWGRWEISEISK